MTGVRFPVSEPLFSSKQPVSRVTRELSLLNMFLIGPLAYSHS